LTVDDALVSRDYEVRIASRPSEKPFTFASATTSGAERDLTWKLGSRKTREYEVVEVPEPNSSQLLHRRSWLNAPEAKVHPRQHEANERACQRLPAVIRTLVMLAFWALALTPHGSVLFSLHNHHTGDATLLYKVAIWFRGRRRETHRRSLPSRRARKA